MDKNAIKKYAVWARRELISRVSQKALQYGITAENYEDRDADSINGVLLSAAEKNQRKALLDKILGYRDYKTGYEQVIEEVAYTWFNRFTALRFMEVNGYLPTHIKVFTDEHNAFKPQILTEAIHINLMGLKRDVVLALKETNKEDELYKYLLITQCNALNEVLPMMFQRIADYTELLFPDNLLREGSVIDEMISEIPEADWKDAVQIIGWLYQYYNIEPKDKVFADLKKNIKISKENIPAATQLFTPDWIVRYMVENSLGKLWVEGHPNDGMKSEWKYYIEEAEQEENVRTKLAEIRKNYALLTPKDIKCIDPCMGSGHILVYMFDVLLQIYESSGYSTRDAVKSIVENNLYGLDIDERATQLAYFAVMMKACSYDSRFLTRGVQPHLYAIKESNDLDEQMVAYFCKGNQHLTDALTSVLQDMTDAKEYGSILQVRPVDFDALYTRFDEVYDDTSFYSYAVWRDLLPVVRVAELLSRKYDIVVTNPPYMGSDGMSPKLREYLQANFFNTRYDLYAVFIERLQKMTGKYLAMITQHSFLYAYCFRNFRESLIKTSEFISAVHLGTRAFEEISGAVVQTISFVLSPRNIGYKSLFIPLTKYTSQKEEYFALVKRSSVITKDFLKFDNYIFAYSLTELMKEIYLKSQRIGDVFDSKAGVVTGKDEYFLRHWQEVNYLEFCKKPTDLDCKYVPYSKGGSFVKWYGNITYALKLRDLYDDNLTNKSVRRGDRDAYFKTCIGWSQMGGGNDKDFSILQNCICGTASPTILSKDESDVLYVLGFLNSKIPARYIECFNPLLSTYISDICNLPYVSRTDIRELVITTVKECLKLAQKDWDSFETSWDFLKHPLVPMADEWQEQLGSQWAEDRAEQFSRISSHFEWWRDEALFRFKWLKKNEEELNRIFIDIYGLQDELTPVVEDKDVTVRLADLGRDIRSLISYAVGCMFGRYSIYKRGLMFAGGEFDMEEYEVLAQEATMQQGGTLVEQISRYCSETFLPDADGIIPICDDEYFGDDIVGKFVKFIEVVYGKNTLEENLTFIANALGGKGTPREVIRNYFINDFYNDHLKTYQKRPIYWLFDSGKKGGFKALVYMHRYQPDTIARMRTDYVHEQQAKYRTAMEDLERRMADASTSERVKLNKKYMTIKAQAEEIHAYEEKVHHFADQMISIDLDDGVVKNYAIFQDILAKIK